jgi:multicomponent K+:H+ antiporter subunit E
MSVLRKLVPAPLLSLVLFALWLVLQRSASAGHLTLALALGILVPLLTTKIRGSRARVRRPLVAARFLFVVGYDVLRSNFEIAWDLMIWRWRKPSARFVTIPLELRDPFGLAALAMVTTVVPGTVWSEIALDRTALRLHVWDLGEEEVFVARFKARYEKPLREIFE